MQHRSEIEFYGFIILRPYELPGTVVILWIYNFTILCDFFIIFVMM